MAVLKIKSWFFDQGLLLEVFRSSAADLNWIYHMQSKHLSPVYSLRHVTHYFKQKQTNKQPVSIRTSQSKILKYKPADWCHNSSSIPQARRLTVPVQVWKSSTAKFPLAWRRSVVCSIHGLNSTHIMEVSLLWRKAIQIRISSPLSQKHLQCCTFRSGRAWTSWVTIPKKGFGSQVVRDRNLMLFYLGKQQLRLLRWAEATE